MGTRAYAENTLKTYPPDIRGFVRTRVKESMDNPNIQKIVEEMQEKARNTVADKVHTRDGKTWLAFEDIDTLIASTAQAVLEARDREVRKIVEGMKVIDFKDCNQCNACEVAMECEERGRDRAWNQALTALLTHLTTKV
jgi:hypothetical protein